MEPLPYFTRIQLFKCEQTPKGDWNKLNIQWAHIFGATLKAVKACIKMGVGRLYGTAYMASG